MQDKTKDTIIAILIVVIFILIVSIGCLIWTKNDTLKEITGTVIIADREYVIIETEGEDYLINSIDETYEVGDEVKFSYKAKNLDKNSTPKAITVEDETLLKKAPQKTDDEMETPDIQTDSDSSLKPPVQNDTANPPVSSVTADEEVLTYMNDLNAQFSTTDLSDTIKGGFITVIDFIFYDGSIADHTFKELSESAKLKVLEMALYFDEKIDKYFPGYKESITSTTGKIYTSAKNEIVSTYLNVAAKACESNAELCDTAKDAFSKIKTNLGITWSLIKEIAGDGISSLKNWYEIWSGKRN